MGRSYAFWISALLLGAAALASWWMTPASFHDIFQHPFESLWTTHQQLDTHLLEVSETLDPVSAAGRRLLKPFGAVRVIRTFQPKEPDLRSDKR